ncbi:transglutaminase domain-containing protein [Bernardetia sp. ABR2-2B]|uniref:transglutaminase domain-containing protein n=1 Tax=Bernardetia sp. ABR2-2B TaxID=3127472 RepID=UPI0030D0C2AB
MIRFFCILFLLSIEVAKAQVSDFESVDFRKADSVANHYEGESVENLPLLSYKLTNSLPSDVEKFRAIYTWVSKNIENDYLGYVKNRRKRQKFQDDSLALKNWNKSFLPKVFEKLVKEKKTLCTGYAYLVRELATMSDIECKIIDGYGRTATTNTNEENSIPNHSWNAVKLNNKWYLCDATWSSGFFDTEKNEFISEYNEGYFLAEPKLFLKNHYPLEEKWMLLENKPSLSQFLKAPLVYKYTFNYQLIPVEPQKMKIEIGKNEIISFLFEAPDSLKTETIELELSLGSSKYSKKPLINRTKEGFLELKYTFEKLGHYDVHIKIDNQYLVTYTVRVRRNKK